MNYKSEIINVEGRFSNNEKILINNLNTYFYLLTNRYVHGRVVRRGDFVRYELYFEHNGKEEQLVLQFCLRDNEEVSNFVHISNIVIPLFLRRKGIANGIITIMSKVGEYNLKMPLYITQIVNEEWKKSLIYHGGIEDDDGDILIEYYKWVELNCKYGVAFLNNNEPDDEPIPRIFNCCCIEEIKMVAYALENQNCKKIIPFCYKENEEVYTWEYVIQNKIK